MRRIVNKYLFLIAFLFVSAEFYAQPNPEPPEVSCCLTYYEEGSPEFDECEAAEIENLGLGCSEALPIDNSFYILMGAAAAFSLASVVILKKIKHKKTPM